MDAKLGKGHRFFTFALAFVLGIATASTISSNSIFLHESAKAVTVDNGLQQFCSNKMDGTISFSSSGYCDPVTEEPFVFLSVAQMGSNGFKPKSICGVGGKSLCRLGVLGPGGGTIFFVDSNNDYPNFTYLEIAPAGWATTNSKSDPSLSWCNDVTHVIQSSSNPWTTRAIGLGKPNTALMELSCTSGASAAVHEFNLSKRNRYSDWYIPSLGELILLGRNLQGKAEMQAEDYWSSSEFSDVGAWVQSIGHGYQGNANKATLFHVRPIRSF